MALRKTFSGAMLTLLLTAMLMLTFEIQPAKAGTIIVPDDYTHIQEAINAASDGDTIQVSEGTYQESLYINKTLTLTAQNKENTILNGKGKYSVIEVNSTTVVITGFTIINGSNGILLKRCGGSILKQNHVSNCSKGIWLQYSGSNTVSENIIANCESYGILLCGHSSKNTITRNTIKDSGNGLGVTGQNNLIYHNNFQNNQNQTTMINSFANDWNNTCEGNYWSDYTGVDSNHDGIGDTPYIIDENNQDNYPLMGEWWNPADINNDGTVGIKDLYPAASAFGTHKGEDRWNCRADVDKDDYIGIKDLYLIASNWGKTH